MSLFTLSAFLNFKSEPVLQLDSRLMQLYVVSELFGVSSLTFSGLGHLSLGF